jgi:hypothetical protein
MSSLDEDSLGKIVIATHASGSLAHFGSVVSYCEVPQVCIRNPKGEHIWWRADFCRVMTDTEKDMYFAFMRDRGPSDDGREGKERKEEK